LIPEEVPGVVGVGDVVDADEIEPSAADEIFSAARPDSAQPGDG
jgi:hypothetical protein